jgi:hypothetical protein
MDNIDASDEISRMLSEEFTKQIDAYILNILGAIDKRVHRRNKIEELWPNELM